MKHEICLFWCMTSSKESIYQNYKTCKCRYDSHHNGFESFLAKRPCDFCSALSQHSLLEFHDTRCLTEKLYGLIWEITYDFYFPLKIYKRSFY